MATAFVIDEPGTRRMGIRRGMAGLGGRMTTLGFTSFLATAVGKGEPGNA
jgi:hypothetical protein